MGEVFAAENIHTGRHVAIKLLRSESKNKTSAVVRFRREARAAGSINSDHVTQVLDVHEDDEHGILLVFELLEGESLIDRLKRSGPIRFEELHAIIEQVWIGLADAHRAGIIHRDLKPSNVYLERRPDGTTRVKILDFGVSKLPKEMGGDTLTEMGQSLGTFSFMPPEQISKAKTVDHRADIYACTTLIYQALTGHLPYQARNILAMVELKTKTEPRRLSEVMEGPVDPRLEAFVAMGLARDPAQRFQTAHEALAAWRELRPGGPTSQPASMPTSHPLSTGSAALSTASTAPRVQAQAQAEGAVSAPPNTPRGGMPASAPGSVMNPPSSMHAGHPHAPPASAAQPPYHAALQAAPTNVLVRAPMQQPQQATPPASGPPASPLGMTSSDFAATLARPPQPQRAPEAPHQQHAAPGNHEMVQQGRMLGPYGTALVDQATGLPIQPYPTPAGGLPAGRHDLPRIYDESSSGPPSHELKTQVYRPRSASAMPFPPELPANPPPTPPPPAPEPAPPDRRLLALGLGFTAVLVAIVVALVVLWWKGVPLF